VKFHKKWGVDHFGRWEGQGGSKNCVRKMLGLPVCLSQCLPIPKSRAGGGGGGAVGDFQGGGGGVEPRGGGLGVEARGGGSVQFFTLWLSAEVGGSNRSEVGGGVAI